MLSWYLGVLMACAVYVPVPVAGPWAGNPAGVSRADQHVRPLPWLSLCRGRRGTDEPPLVAFRRQFSGPVRLVMALV